ALTVETKMQTESVSVRAKEADVKNGFAKSPGVNIEKKIIIQPVAVYFENVLRADAEDPNSIKEGAGVFRFQIWILSKISLDVEEFSKAGLSTASFAFDIIFPFIVLFIVSLLT